jgi:hypothetical protein
MARPCSACADPRRPELDAALVSGAAFRAIARRFAPLSRDAIRRHRPHVATAIVKAHDAEEVANGDTLLRQIQDLHRRTLAILTAAEQPGGDARAALVAIRESRENLALLSRLSGEIAGRAEARPVLDEAERDHRILEILNRAAVRRAETASQ